MQTEHDYMDCIWDALIICICIEGDLLVLGLLKNQSILSSGLVKLLRNPVSMAPVLLCLTA